VSFFYVKELEHKSSSDRTALFRNIAGMFLHPNLKDNVLDGITNTGFVMARVPVSNLDLKVEVAQACL
jgi:hypothetical protein